MVGNIDHIAIAVWNIDESLLYYRDKLGFEVIGDEQLPSAGVRLAYLGTGNTMLQLVQPIGTTPIRAFLEEKGEGLHHLCLAVDNIPNVLATLPGESGTRIVMGGRDRRACFLGHRPNGVPIELTEIAPYPRLDNRKIFVLDDDPTGTQTVSDVDVILHPDIEAYRRFLRSGRQAVFVLTNTRSMPRDQAEQFIRGIKADIEQAAAEAQVHIAYVLRGDSTLRGHVFAEMSLLVPENGVGLFVPAFPECGRVTVGGVHYLLEGETLRPVCETEFARDTTFGYRSRSMQDWVNEVGGAHGWKAHPVSLEQIRKYGSAAVKEALLHAEPGTVVIPDAENESDITFIVNGLIDAEREGKVVAVRGASTLARIRCGLSAKPVDSVGLDEASRVLVVCGSHTQASTEQLNRLVADSGVEPVVIPMKDLLDEGVELVAARLAKDVISCLNNRRIAILATERVIDPKYGNLNAGALVMEALTNTVRLAAGHYDGVISKGGITSAQIASDGMGAATANVVGQLEPGVSAWRLHLPEGREMPYAVIPGNVGNSQTMINVARKFGSTKAWEDGE